MKRGAMVLERLVSLLFHLGVVVLLFIILGGFYYTITHGGMTPADRDQDRIIADAKEVVKADEAISLTVPLEATESFLVVAYPPSESPAACGTKACICTYMEKEGSYIEKCRTFSNVRECPEGCSDKPCLIERIEVPSKKQIVISKNECGRLSLS